MNITYEKATEKDAYAISYIGAYSWKETYTGLVPDNYLKYKVNHFEDKVENQKKVIQNENVDFYLAKVDGKAVGYVCYGPSENEKYEDYGYVGGLYLLEEYQGYGIGKELFRIALEGLKEKGYTKLMLECMSGNKVIDFYKKYLGKVVEKMDYPLNNGKISVGAEVMTFDIEDSLKEISESKNKTM